MIQRIIMYLTIQSAQKWNRCNLKVTLFFLRPISPSKYHETKIYKKLDFVAAILDFWRPSWIDNGYYFNPVLYIKW